MIFENVIDEYTNQSITKIYHDEASFHQLFIRGFNLRCLNSSKVNQLFLHIKFSLGFDLKESQLYSLLNCDKLYVKISIHTSNFDV